MSEVADACQIVMVSGRMIAVAGQLSLKLAMLMMKVFNTLYLGKWKGSTNFKRFRDIKGENYEFINICTENEELLAKIETEMAAHNLLFARLPDLCGGDGNTQYVVAKSDMHIFKAFLTDHIHGELKSIKVGPIDESDYAKTAVHPESGEYTKEFKDLNESARQYYRESRLQLTVKGGERENTKSREEYDAAPGWEEAPAQNSPERFDKVFVSRYGRREEVILPDLLEDAQVRLQNERLKHGDKLEVIYEDPVKEGEKWAAFPVHDGDHIIIVPKDDMLTGNTTREKTHRLSPIEKPPKAMLYTSKNYVVMDIRSGEKNICDGQSVIDMLRAPSLSQQKEQLDNLTRNIAKNVGEGAMMPPLPRKRGGR